MRLRPSPVQVLAVVAAVLLAAPSTRAMSVIAPTFDQLVATADVVARGVVTDIHCITAETSQGTAIKTLVTLRIERAIKGAPGAEITLSFLGGKVGRRTLTVLGMPAFKVGDREIVFVGNNGRVICPLIAAGYGRYHVRHDAATGRDYVARDNNAPLVSTEAMAETLDGGAPTAAPGAAMSLETFETRIAAAVAGTNPLAQP